MSEGLVEWLRVGWKSEGLIQRIRVGWISERLVKLDDIAFIIWLNELKIGCLKAKLNERSVGCLKAWLIKWAKYWSLEELINWEKYLLLEADWMSEVLLVWRFDWMSEDWYYDWAKNTLLWAKSALNVPNMSEMNQCEHSLAFFGLATVILVNQSPKRE